MRYDIGRIFATSFGSEIIYSFVIIAASLMIYFGTRELYELSAHKGINYFRQAFLFFAIAYFFRTFIKFLLVYFGVNEIITLSPGFIGAVTLVLFIYAGTMAMLFIVYSMIWKKLGWFESNTILMHVASAVLAFYGVMFRNLGFLLGLTLALFVFASVSAYASYREARNKKRGQNLFVIYILLFAFWILNIIEILTPRFLQTTSLVIYLISLGIFLTILYKVLRRTGAN